MAKSSFSIEGKNGTIRGVCYHPDEQTPVPAIIISHEFGLCMASTARYARRLFGHGYAVFIYDFCGSGCPLGKSIGLPSTEMSVLTEADDLKDVLSYAAGLPYVDSQHVILGGCSQGGLVTALVAAEWEDRIEKIFLYYPALCIPDDARRGCIIGTNIDANHIPAQFTAMGYVKLGRKYVEDARGLDPWDQICRYSRPVLICHGTADGIAKISYARKAHELYPDNRLVEIDGAHHVFPFKGVGEAIQATLGFLKA